MLPPDIVLLQGEITDICIIDHATLSSVRLFALVIEEEAQKSIG